jgi:hypothetical protein
MISNKTPHRREIEKTASQRWRERHPERHRVSSRKMSIKKLGLIYEEVNEYFENHNGLCDICESPPTDGKTNLNIDHDHKTGEFRGLLCGSCNRALGLFKDSAEILTRAAAYLVERKNLDFK